MKATVAPSSTSGVPAKQAKPWPKIVAGIAVLGTIIATVVVIVVVTGSSSNGSTGSGSTGGSTGSGSPAPTAAELASDKAAWNVWPADGLFVPWPATITIDKTRFASLSPPPSTFTGAQAFLASQGTGSYQLPFKPSVLGAQNKFKGKPPIKIGFFAGQAGDVTDTEFQIVADIIEVMAWLIPNVTIDAATTVAEVNCAVLVANAPTGPGSEWTSMGYKTDGPSAQWTAHPNTSPKTLWIIRVSNQAPSLPCGGTSGSPCTNRHSMTHEFGHAFGLEHFPYPGSLMSPPSDQKSYLTQTDMAAIAAVQDDRVKAMPSSNGPPPTQVTATVCSSLGVTGTCPTSMSAAEFAAAAPTGAWATVEAWMCARMGGRPFGYTCDIPGAADVSSGLG